MKRILLFLATNLAVLLLLSVVIHLLGLDAWFTAQGGSFASLLAFCAVFGFGGAFISLAMSRPMAKAATGARVIAPTDGPTQAWLYESVRELADRAGLPMPQVAIYDGAPNAFATGATRNRSLVAVSTGLLQTMRRDEIKAVLAHEVAHIANGDMVTLTLLQGVLNTFVMFVARIVGRVVAARAGGQEGSSGGVYLATVLVLQLVLGLFASLIVAAFSRYREYRADAGAAQLMGTPTPMIAALERLGGLRTGGLPEAVSAFGISPSAKRALSLLASHPPLESRIERLRSNPPTLA